MRRGWVLANGITLSYQDWGGAGRPCLLLHGVFGRTTTWEATALSGVPVGTQVGQELQPGGQWLHDLNAGDETPGEIRYMTIYHGTGQFDPFYPRTARALTTSA